MHSRTGVLLQEVSRAEKSRCPGGKAAAVGVILIDCHQEEDTWQNQGSVKEKDREVCSVQCTLKMVSSAFISHDANWDIFSLQFFLAVC